MPTIRGKPERELRWPSLPSNKSSVRLRFEPALNLEGAPKPQCCPAEHAHPVPAEECQTFQRPHPEGLLAEDGKAHRKEQRAESGEQGDGADVDRKAGVSPVGSSNKARQPAEHD